MSNSETRNVRAGVKSSAATPCVLTGPCGTVTAPTDPPVCPDNCCFTTNCNLAAYAANSTTSYNATADAIGGLGIPVDQQEARNDLLCEVKKRLDSSVTRAYVKLFSSKCNQPCCASASAAIKSLGDSTWSALSNALINTSLSTEGDEDSMLSQQVDCLLCSFDTMLKAVLLTVLCPKEKCKPSCVYRVECPKRSQKKSCDKKKSCSSDDDNDDNDDDDACDQDFDNCDKSSRHKYY